jgi:hypothetical protein
MVSPDSASDSSPSLEFFAISHHADAIPLRQPDSISPTTSGATDLTSVHTNDIEFFGGPFSTEDHRSPTDEDTTNGPGDDAHIDRARENGNSSTPSHLSTLSNSAGTSQCSMDSTNSHEPTPTGERARAAPGRLNAEWRDFFRDSLRAAEPGPETAPAHNPGGTPASLPPPIRTATNTPSGDAFDTKSKDAFRLWSINANGISSKKRIRCSSFPVCQSQNQVCRCHCNPRAQHRLHATLPPPEIPRNLQRTLRLG